MTERWRLLVELDEPPSAAEQMARDEALLDQVVAGAPPALRIYRWRVPALTLGRFQPDDHVDRAACHALGVEVARRPTGGRALLHGADLTYAVALTRPSDVRDSVEALYAHLAGALIGGLARIGVRAEVASHDGDPGPVCFASALGSDLRVGSRKVCGSAQVHRGPAVLQHGSVLLGRLDLDEGDLMHFDDETARARARSRLRDATVTLTELGAPTDPAHVAAALVDGFADVLGADFGRAQRHLRRHPGRLTST